MPIQEYIAAVNRIIDEGVQTEHPFREALSVLLRAVATNAVVINDPGATEHGNPDLHIVKNHIAVGYVETKAPGLDLDAFERSEQFLRYLRGFTNLLVTNYGEFRWYVNHEKESNLSAKLDRDPRGRFHFETSNARTLQRLLKAFVDQESAQPRTAIDLAKRLAARARTIRDVIDTVLASHDDDELLQQKLAAFRSVLIPGLSVSDFSDMYAQTITYGLFAARAAHPDEVDFNRLTAPHLLPLSNPFLGNVFDDIAGRNLHPRIEGLVDELCALLRASDIHQIIAEFTGLHGPEDPVVHFYETFLKEYDADVRRDRGVFYTPRPVVSFIVRSVDGLLRTQLGIQSGLSDRSKIVRNDTEVHKLQILDPATGTGTFLLEVIQKVRESFQGQAGVWPTYVREHLLPRMHGFELLISPYTIAHLKVGLALSESGFEFQRNERLSIFLTNALEDTVRAVARLPFENFLTQEASAANEIKQQRPIMVVLGNPPYSVRSGNMGPNARRLAARYRSVDGIPIREGGTLALQRVIENDYVKFVALAQEAIERNGEGIVGFITSNSYLDSPVLAGFRESLFHSFDLIQIVDLHGYARASSDGDQNIFTQIGEGVAIILLTRSTADGERTGQVQYSSIRGSRAEKRAWLDANDISTIPWTSVAPEAPDYRFVPEDPRKRRRYSDEFVSLSDIFDVRRGAIVTARDEFAIGFTPQAVLTKLETFRDHAGSLEEASIAVGANWRGDWMRGMAKEAKTWLRANQNLRQFIQPIVYRPFDVRYVFFEDHFLDTPARAVMDYMTGGDNLALLFGRSVRYGIPDHFFVSRVLAEAKSAEASRQCYAAHLFSSAELFEDRTPNFKPEFRQLIRGQWGQDFSSLQIFGYIYAVLYSSQYRKEFAELICREVARIPIIQDSAVAARVAELGLELVTLHTRPEQTPTVTVCNTTGQNTLLDDVETRWQQADDGSFTLHLNHHLLIEGIPEAVKDFRIGGYPVLDKWLGYREGEELTTDDIEHIQHTVASLNRTGEVISEIDRSLGRLLR